jgi:photosystem II stability/assembly factor-like uncharacterized protein
MRFVRYTVLSVMGLLAGALATAQTFDLQNPFPMTSTLLRASNAGSTVYAGGTQGTVLKSTDGGTHWARLMNVYDAASRFNSVLFANASTGYAFGVRNGNSVIALKTVDGGDNFLSSATGLSSNLDARDAHFTAGNTNDIWLAGYNTGATRGALYHSVNAGGSWAEMVTGATVASANYWYNHVFFPSTTAGFAVGFDQINNAGIFVATTNGGTSWQRRVPVSIAFPAGANMRSVHFVSATRGWVVGQDGTSKSFLLETNDAGFTWVRRAEGDIVRGLLLDIDFLPNNLTGWAVGDSTDLNGQHWQVVLGSTDGGTTWNRQDNAVTQGTLYDVQPASTLNAWGVGTTGNGTSLVMNYIGSGLWYQQSRSYFGGNLTALAFPSRTVGYAVGHMNAGITPTVLATQNAGYSWSSLNVVNTLGAPLLTSSSALSAVQFFSNSTGWIAGQNNNQAAVYQTKNNGQSWLTSSTITGNASGFAFLAMRFQDVVIGYAGGKTNTNTPLLYTTTDAGLTWGRVVLNVPTNTGSFLTATAKPGMGLVAGSQTVGATTTWIAMVTVSSGSNWNLLNVPNSYSSMIAKGSWSVSADTAWVVGSSASGGWVGRTTNLAQAVPSFGLTLLPASSSLNGVYFITSRIGYVVGQKSTGTAYFAGTTDGGSTWTELNTSIPVALNTAYVALTNQADVYVAGNSEVVAHTAINLPQSYSYPSLLFQNTNRTTIDTAIAYFAIANTGTSPLTINTGLIHWTNTVDANVPGDYILDPRLMSGVDTVKPGVVDSFMVIFQPRTVGPRIGFLEIPSNSLRGDTIKVQMRGFGGTSSMNFQTTSFGSTFPTLSIHNDTVLVGGGLDDTLFVLNNSGSARLNIHNIALSGVNAADYQITRTITAPIAANGQDTIVVRFTPSDGYNRLARMTLSSDAFLGGNALVLMNGFGGCTESGFLSGTDSLFMKSVLTPGTADSVAYDTVVICNTCALPVQIINQTITGTGTTVFDYFIVDSLNPVLETGTCDTAVIAFFPTAGSADTMPRYATFEVRTNGRLSGTLRKTLAGTACSRLVITSPVAFSDSVDVVRNAGAKFTHVSNIMNTGVCDLNIDSIAFVGDSAAWSAYRIVHAPLGGVLAHGASDSLVVEFAPDTNATAGVKPVAVVLYTNSPTVPSQTVNYNDIVLKDVAVRENVSATSFALEQNFPNPFAGTTMFRYALPTRQHVALRVLNTLGQTVGTPVNALQDAGTYRVDFNAGYLPVGQYIYELRTGTTVISRTMTIIR